MIRSGLMKTVTFKRVRFFGVLFFGVIPLLMMNLTGCTGAAEESEPVLLVDEEVEPDVAGNLPAEYSDVVSTMSFSVKYRAAATQDLSFDVVGVDILKSLVFQGFLGKKIGLLPL